MSGLLSGGLGGSYSSGTTQGPTTSGSAGNATNIIDVGSTIPNIAQILGEVNSGPTNTGGTEFALPNPLQYTGVPFQTESALPGAISAPETTTNKSPLIILGIVAVLAIVSVLIFRNKNG